MNTIEIDSDVYRYLQRKAIAYIEKPNDTLRRIFSLDNQRTSEVSHTKKYNRKRPRTKLRTLKSKGIISEGEILYFRDYQGNIIEGVQAVIQGEKLLYDGKVLSMSQHAVNILRKLGFTTADARGPQFWWTKGGNSILQLWDAHLKDYSK